MWFDAMHSQKGFLELRNPPTTLSYPKMTGTLEQNPKNACNPLIILKKPCSNFRKRLEQRWNKQNKILRHPAIPRSLISDTAQNQNTTGTNTAKKSN